eukprot:10489649-Alexandrium_andersonii.AAC.1
MGDARTKGQAVRMSVELLSLTRICTSRRPIGTPEHDHACLLRSRPQLGIQPMLPQASRTIQGCYLRPLDRSAQ